MIELRPLTAADRAALVAFVLADPEHTRTCFDRTPSPADADELLSGRPFGADAEPPTLLGAFDDGTLAGVVEWATRWPTPATCYIGVLHVHPEHRRQGVATALLARVEEAARARGCRQLMLAVIARNRPARAFWTRLGYVHLTPGRAQRAGPLEAVVMYRALPRPGSGAPAPGQPSTPGSTGATR